MPPSSSPILVTGANGFVALHTILQLLAKGYSVRGTLRNTSQGDQIKATLAKFSDQTNRIEFVRADLMQDDGWAGAVQGCEYVMHLASPFPLHAPEDENELIAPARDGTLRVLRAANAAGVKRVVLISSMLAVRAGHEGENRTFDEQDWANLEHNIPPYPKSKALAERAAWDFAHGAENTNHVELAVINAASINGPFLDTRYATSSELFRTLMRHEVPGVVRVKQGIVDVRDVAAALVAAMTPPQAADQRFCCIGGQCWMRDLALILQKHFADRGYNVPTRQIPDPLVRLLAMINPKVRIVVPELGWDYTVSTERIKRVLGWQPRPLTETIVDQAESMVQLGLV